MIDYTDPQEAFRHFENLMHRPGYLEEYVAGREKMPKVYNPDDLMLTDAVFIEDEPCPRDGKPLTLLVGYDYDERGAHLVAALVKETCCELTEDEVYEVEESAKLGYQAPEYP